MKSITKTKSFKKKIKLSQRQKLNQLKLRQKLNHQTKKKLS